jgi:hypothetical protein
LGMCAVIMIIVAHASIRYCMATHGRLKLPCFVDVVNQ